MPRLFRTPPGWLRDTLNLIRLVLLPPPRRLDLMFDRIERQP